MSADILNTIDLFAGLVHRDAHIHEGRLGAAMLRPCHDLKDFHA